jgi:hypothetical protein
MNLFLFTLQGEPLALPGEEVVQVLPPGGVREIVREGGRRFAHHEGRRLPVLEIEASSPDPWPPAACTFLRVASWAGGEGLLRIDAAGGLVDVEEGDVLPVPGFLFPRGAAPYRGLFEHGGRTVGVLDSGRLLGRD